MFKTLVRGWVRNKVQWSAVAIVVLPAVLDAAGAIDLLCELTAKSGCGVKPLFDHPAFWAVILTAGFLLFMYGERKRWVRIIDERVSADEKEQTKNVERVLTALLQRENALRIDPLIAELEDALARGNANYYDNDMMSNGRDFRRRLDQIGGPRSEFDQAVRSQKVRILSDPQFLVVLPGEQFSDPKQKQGWHLSKATTEAGLSALRNWRRERVERVNPAAMLKSIGAQV